VGRDHVPRIAEMTMRASLETPLALSIRQEPNRPGEGPASNGLQCWVRPSISNTVLAGILGGTTPRHCKQASRSMEAAPTEMKKCDDNGGVRIKLASALY
jgi:hypothetical protein